MNKKEIITPILVIGLSILFAGICLAVFLTRGKSKKWIAHKIKIGGILLSLTSISFGSGCISCYDQASPVIIQFEGYAGHYISLYPNSERTLTGTLYEVNSTAYSFSIEDSTQVFQKNEIIAVDGAFDSASEQIRVEIDNGLPEGNYSFSIYSTTVDEQESTAPIEILSLNIINRRKS